MSTQRTSLIVVGTIWALVGVGLSTAGSIWLSQLSVGPKLIIFLAIAASIGIAKGKFVLSKVAMKYYKRSEVINFSKKDIFTGWAKIMGVRGAFLVFIMMTLGKILRHSSIDRPILGIIYLAVGIALLYASKVFFEAKNIKEKTA